MWGTTRVRSFPPVCSVPGGPGKGPLERWREGMLTVGGAGCGARGGRWRAAAVFSHSFPRSSYLLSVWLW